MSQTPEVTYGEFIRFLALALHTMGEQAMHLNSGLHSLFYELGNNLEVEQKQRFEENLKRSQFLKSEIIGSFQVYKLALKLIYEPAEVEHEEFDVYAAVDSAIQFAERFVSDFSGWVIVNRGEKAIQVSSLFSLWADAIAGLLIYIRLMDVSSRIFIDLAQSETDIILTISGYTLPFKAADYVDEQASSLSFELSSFCLSLLGGFLNWKDDQAIPDKLVMQFPR